MSRVFRWLVFGLLATALIVGLVFLVSSDARKSAQLAALDKIGDAATKQIASNPDAAGTVAADFINIPIKAREIAPGIWQATGVGNAHLITSPNGHILFDTGLPTQVAKQIKALEPHMDGVDVSHIVLSHSHADHSGGAKAWYEDGMDIIAHKEFAEEQRYLTELQDYQWDRNRTLFPFMPEEPPTLGLIAYGGIEPTIEVSNGEPFVIDLGDRTAEVIALPGAEGSDNLVLWLPKDRILFSGDFFGPIFPQFPNVFTMRGEKIRKPVEYIRSLEAVMALDPLIIVPSHRDPVTDKAVIDDGLRRMHGATQYVHGAVVEGMNAGKSVETLMAEIALPPDLDLTQEHGKVSWAVKSIWEYYMTWFHFDDTTELYEVPKSSVSGDLIALAGAENISRIAAGHVDSGKPLEALHLIQIVLDEDPANREALKVKTQALGLLLDKAEATHKNAYEIYWLKAQIREAQSSFHSEVEIQ